MSRRILLVEDDPVARKVLILMLQRANFEVVVAEDGDKGVEMWEQGGCDVVLMDVQMPRMDGLEATRLIREKERSRGGHSPIIALTAHALKMDEEKCLDAGMDAYVSKPIDLKECLQLIGETLKKLAMLGDREQATMENSFCRIQSNMDNSSRIVLAIALNPWPVISFI
jgi:CheY-like chemotaxis protein